ncbi:hypothetical protein Zmor_000107 [Zophobas morio]|uniref:DUF4806 domain-containing protein n=2 Tax=Zophobas morio TaxID=2755281 RepID=A0AA38J0U8_9CUCU|nr:hypothetical protein Zmor_000107 [Zophobas morio]
MPFKIVQTIEGGRFYFSIVPSKWEKDGLLRWPPKSLLVKLAHVENSSPEEKWETVNCVMKRELLTKEEAERELTRIERRCDLDHDEEANPIKSVARDPKAGHFRREIPEETLTDSRVFIPKLRFLEDHEKRILHTEMDIKTETEDNLCLQPTTTGESSCSCNINVLRKKVDYLIDNQSRMISQITNMQKSLAIVANIISRGNKITPTREPAEPVRIQIEQINSVGKLDELEAQLEENDFMEMFIKSHTNICGTDGKQNGLDCCYQLIDYFISRMLFMEISWTGNAKGEGTSKVPFKFYRNFRKSFFCIIKHADKDFTETLCDTFFKRIIKNSKQRLLAQNQMTAKHKCRPKNLKYKKTRLQEEPEEQAMDFDADEGEESLP